MGGELFWIFVAIRPSYRKKGELFWIFVTVFIFCREHLFSCHAENIHFPIMPRTLISLSCQKHSFFVILRAQPEESPRYP